MVRQIRISLFCIRCGRISSLCSKCSCHIPKSDSINLLITQATDSLNAVYDTLYTLQGKMLRLASLLPEFDVVMEMQSAGKIIGSQLMAEIGDVFRFTHKGALVTFTGMDAPPFQSGTFDSKSRRISKRASPHLRRTLFQIASIILQHSDPANPVLQFMDKSGPMASTFTSTL